MAKTANEFAFVTAADIAGIEAIEKESFTFRLPPNSFKDAINTDGSYLETVKSEEIVVGYLFGTYTDFDGEIVELAISTGYRRNGLARALLGRYETFLKPRESLFLEVRKDNLAAIRLYESCGYQSYGIRKKYYRDGQAALLYRKRLIK